MITDTIRAHLKTKASITALVGTGNDARIYDEYQRQGASLPHIVFEEFEGASQEHLGGITGLAEQRIQITAFAANKSGSHALAELIRRALQGYRGTVSGQFINGITSPDGYEAGHDKPTKGANDQRFFHARDYFVYFTESAVQI